MKRIRMTQPRWVIKSVILLLLSALVFSYLIWKTQQFNAASLYVHNHTDRPVFSYWVNENWGGNAGVYGGGKTTCCWRIQGETLKVVWIFDVTPEQVERGLEEERHEVVVRNPARDKLDDTLHVHFIPDNQVRLVWNRSAESPLSKELIEAYPRRGHDNK